ncbi:MAG: threonylcarbamoyl-AMP synthase [Propionibacteriaceae bacterium]|nr:threonylcarbamoyl-AMP synthase [Propionibacteriaceae bacterium]
MMGDDGLVEAVLAVLRRDDCVVLPTDTVYGLAALAGSARAVQRLQAAKGRGDDFPPPVLVADLAAVESWTGPLPPAAGRLAEAYWPGPLTLVLPLAPTAPPLARPPGAEIAWRVPDHPELRQLLRATGPLATSSANRHGHPAATTVDQARRQLGRSVALYVDGGPTPGPTPSTVVALAPDGPRVLRPGRLSPADIAWAVAG